LLNTPGIDVNAKRNNGRTPLLRAANLGHIEVVELLLKTPGIDINAVDQWGRTPLFRAANDGHDEIVRMLKAAGAVEY